MLSSVSLEQANSALLPNNQQEWKHTKQGGETILKIPLREMLKLFCHIWLFWLSLKFAVVLNMSVKKYIIVQLCLRITYF